MKTLLEIVANADYSQLAKITIETEDERIYAAIRQAIAGGFLNATVRDFNVGPKASPDRDVLGPGA